MAGASRGSGKSTAARAFGQHFAVPVMDKDVILTGLLDAGFEADPSPPAADDVLFGLARALVHDPRRPVIVDRPMAYEETFHRLGRIAEEAGAEMIPSLCLADRDTRTRRVAARAALASQPVRVNRTGGRGRERIPFLPASTIEVDTDRPAADTLPDVVAAIARWLGWVATSGNKG